MLITKKPERGAVRGVFSLLLALAMLWPSLAQEDGLGVLVNEEKALDGYTFIAPQVNSLAYIIDNEGRVIRQWDFGSSTREMHLLDSGNILVVRSARDIMDYTLMPKGYPPDGGFAEFTWDGELVWEYNFVDAELHQHHGIDVLPNGNIIAVVRKYYHIDDAIALGLDPAIVEAQFDGSELFLPDAIMEVDRVNSEIVWVWDPMDHLVQELDENLPNYGDVSLRPERIDINYQPYYLKGIANDQSAGAADWTHTNMVNYNPVLDQIVMSVRSFDELWIVDHNLTSEQAAGPSGDLLYRWGNPFTYGQGSLAEDRALFQQHDVQWIDEGLPGAGNILIYNNRNNLVKEDEISEAEYSSVIEISPPLREDGSYDWAADAQMIWQYGEGFFSHFISGVQRLPNGNTLITEGNAGRLIEVTLEGDVVWEFINPMIADGFASSVDELDPEARIRNWLFRARKYPAYHPGLAGKDLSPGAVIGE
jgi:hypothetical protein